MSRHWKEKLDISRHRDYMCSSNDDGITPEPTGDNLKEQWVYFVEVCSFTFQFHSLAQIEACLAFFRQKIHPSSKASIPPLKHWYHEWHERLPQRLFERTKREKVIEALARAKSDSLTGRARAA